MTAFFDYPKSAAFGRVVPKNKIYEHADANTALKDLFVREVDQIVWRFKLAPETTNLDATAAVGEVQVFGISLKTGHLDEAVLRAIDKAIPFPLIFELTWRGKRKATAAFKRPSEADGSKWVISEYFATDWAPEDAPREPLPVSLDLGALYDRLLTAMMSVCETTYDRNMLRLTALRISPLLNNRAWLQNCCTNVKSSKSTSPIQRPIVKM